MDGGAGSDEQFLVFNVTNPESLRDNVRQSAIEVGLWLDIVAGLSEVREEPNVRSVEPKLIGGLVRATIVKLGWAIGGKDQERNAGFACLEHRGKVVRGRAPGRAEKQRGTQRAARLSEPEMGRTRFSPSMPPLRKITTSISLLIDSAG